MNGFHYYVNLCEVSFSSDKKQYIFLLVNIMDIMRSNIVIKEIGNFHFSFQTTNSRLLNFVFCRLIIDCELFRGLLVNFVGLSC